MKTSNGWRPPDVAPVVRLHRLEGFAVIIFDEAGILFRAQTGGTQCRQEEARGCLVPVPGCGAQSEQAVRFHEHFVTGKWRGCCSDGMDAESADFVDEVFASSPGSRRLRVDRRFVTSSHEAWIYVRIVDADPADGDAFENFLGAEGVLTWPNSD